MAATRDYCTAMEQFFRSMTDMETITLEGVQQAIAPICELFRISKAVTCFYQNPRYEAMHVGEELVGFDNGKGGHIVRTHRMTTTIMSVIVCTVWMEDGEEPWNAEEEQRMDLVMRTLQVFISRQRLQKIVDRLTFKDDADYYNLRWFMQYIEREGHAGRLRGTAAIHFNLKHFSLINQQIGRTPGDVVMRSFFNGLESIIMEKEGVLCRVGGDNFIGITDLSLLERVLSYLHGTAIAYDAEHPDERVMVCATVGVMKLDEDFEYHDPSDIMDKIIPAAQAARGAGTMDMIIYDEKMSIGRERMARIQQLFPIALEKEEFHVFYQPKIDVNGERLAGAEALCRWFHDGKMISPADFIPVLEQGMEICRLDFYMLDHVCRDIRRWLDEGKPVVRVSVNLSRKHMMDYDLLEHIIEIVDRNNVPHKYIEIELTETTTDVEFVDLKRVVNGLQQAGICTSVDDFGMGYSSLNLIKEIPWNVLKVDKSFLPNDDEEENSRKNVMFKYVVAMARELGLECIAEGVETSAQVQVLKNNHCDLAQGFFYDRPLPVEEFEKRFYYADSK